jgi:hypothetical protein
LYYYSKKKARQCDVIAGFACAQHTSAVRAASGSSHPNAVLAVPIYYFCAISAYHYLSCEFNTRS